MAHRETTEGRRVRVSVLVPEESVNQIRMRRTHSCDVVAGLLQIDGETISPRVEQSEHSATGCWRRRTTGAAITRGKSVRMCESPLDSSFLNSTEPTLRFSASPVRFEPYPTASGRKATAFDDERAVFRKTNSVSALGEPFNALSIVSPRSGALSPPPMGMARHQSMESSPFACSAPTIPMQDHHSEWSNPSSDVDPAERHDFISGLTAEAPAADDAAPSGSISVEGLPPPDWSIKTSARFVSAESLEWARNARPAARCAALKDFLRGTATSLDEAEDTASAALHRALLVWQFPAAKTPHQFAMLGETISRRVPSLRNEDEQELADYFEHQQREWDEALCSLYESFRRDLCPFFYCQLPPPTKCTVLFQGMRQAGNPRPRAVLSTSTKPLRDALTKNGVRFTQPNRRPRKAPSIDDFLDDGTPHALVIVDGRADVHALYNFVLNFRSLVSASSVAMPLLLAPQGFENGTARVLRWTHQMISRVSPEDGSLAALHCIDVSGPILPSAFTDLCSLFGGTQRTFDVTVKTDPGTRGLNFNTVPGSTCPVEDVGTMGSSTVPPHAAHLKSRSPLGERVLSQAVCVDGRFSYTSSRT